jgi:hypothetical protein
MKLDAETMALLGQCPRRERLGRKAPLHILGRIEPSAMRGSNLALLPEKCAENSARKLVRT